MGHVNHPLPIRDQEQDPDRWWSQTANGQEVWQIHSPGVWKLRLERGHQLVPDPVRTTECASAAPPASPRTAPLSGDASPQGGSPWNAGRCSGQDVALPPDGTLRCPAKQPLVAHERRREADGSRRVVSVASIHRCRPCQLREPWQWHGKTTRKPRQVSVLFHPRVVGSAPLLWREWERRRHRRVCQPLLHSQRGEMREVEQSAARPDPPPVFLSCAPRAHDRLDVPERLARNTRLPTPRQVTIRRFGVREAVGSLARFGNGFTNADEGASRFPFLGPTRSLRVGTGVLFPGGAFLFPLAAALIGSPPHRFCSLFWAFCSLLSPFRSLNSDERFNTLVAQPVGTGQGTGMGFSSMDKQLQRLVLLVREG